MAFRIHQSHIPGKFYQNPSIVFQANMHFLSSKHLIALQNTKTSLSVHFCYLRSQSLKSKSISKKQHDSTVSYLVESCGLSTKSAILASNKINIKSIKKSDSVLELFKKHGFTNAQITVFISKRPVLLLAKADKTLEPKIELFRSLGISAPELAKFLTREPLILLKGLKQMNRAVDFLRKFFKSNLDLVRVLKMLPRYLQCNLEKSMAPNISILRNRGVPELHISKMIMIQPTVLMLKTEKFEASVEYAEKLGFDPKTMGFILAVRTMMALSQPSWERKVDAYRKAGWSKDEMASAFKVQPMCMLISEEKIIKMMDFFVKKLGWNPSLIAKSPSLMLLSLEKRIIPRCSVLNVLISKGLLDKDIYIPQVLRSTERSFLEKFVISYQRLAPEVVKAHKGEAEFRGFGCDIENGVAKIGMKLNRS